MERRFPALLVLLCAFAQLAAAEPIVLPNGVEQDDSRPALMTSALQTAGWSTNGSGQLIPPWQTTVTPGDDPPKGPQPKGPPRDEETRDVTTRNLTPSGVIPPRGYPTRQTRTPARNDSPGSDAPAGWSGDSSAGAGPAADSAGGAAGSSPATASKAAAGGRASGLMSKMAGALKSLGGGTNADGDALKGPAAAGKTGADAIASRGALGVPQATAVGPGAGALTDISVVTPTQRGFTNPLADPAAATPLALMKRPDFHQIVAPSDFIALKTAFTQGGDSRPQFKDIGMTESGRDFKWDRSCAKVSGDCNPHAEAKDDGGYKRNEEVSPETLAAVLAAIDKEMAADSGKPAPERGMRRVGRDMDDLTTALEKPPEDGGEALVAYAPEGATAPGPAREALPPAREKGLWTYPLPLPRFGGASGGALWRPVFWGLSAGAGLGLLLFAWRRRRENDAS